MNANANANANADANANANANANAIANAKSNSNANTNANIKPPDLVQAKDTRPTSTTKSGSSRAWWGVCGLRSRGRAPQV